MRRRAGRAISQLGLTGTGNVVAMPYTDSIADGFTLSGAFAPLTQNLECGNHRMPMLAQSVTR